jgi:magnesium transporter
MTESLNTPSEKSGLPPGALIHVGETLEPETRMAVIDYGKVNIKEQRIQSVEEILQYKYCNTAT